MDSRLGKFLRFVNTFGIARFDKDRFNALRMLEEVQIQCPHCGEYFTIWVDTSQGGYSATEDCAVCCRPIEISVDCNPDEVLEVRAQKA